MKRRSARRRARPRRRRAAAVELRRRRPHRPVAAAGEIRRLGAAPQPAVSRLAHAARAHARRLHRQLERRAHGAGVPAGRARYAARDSVAVRSGVRAHRHPRDQPRLVSVAADLRARAEDPRAGAQPRVAVVCRRRVARSVDAPRPRGVGRAHRSRAAAPPVAADQPVQLSRSRARYANAARVREIRPDVSGRSVESSSSTSSRDAASRTR